MAYVLNSKKPLAGEIVRVGREEYSTIRGLLGGETAPDAEAIHNSRKHFKRLRGLLRLIKTADPELYAARNAACRDAAQNLAGRREIDALSETIDRLATRYQSKKALKIWEVMRNTIAAEGPAAEAETDLAQVREACAEGHASLAQFSARSDANSASLTKSLQTGTTGTYRRARRALKRATNDPTPENFHELRKEVKYHWMHIRLLDGRLPGRRTRRAAMKLLADELGELHDLDVLMRKYGAIETLPDNRRDAFIRLVAREHRRLVKSVLKRAGRLLGDRPAEFARKIAF